MSGLAPLSPPKSPRNRLLGSCVPERTNVQRLIALADSDEAPNVRRHRQRKRDGMRCLIVELMETEVDALIRRKLLDADARNDNAAVLKAVYAHLERSLDDNPWRAT
jgi:SOS response regulatory protein OraA/RecX